VSGADAPLSLPTGLRDELVAHARAVDPDEACGILAGRDNSVERVFPVRNSAEDVDAVRGVFRDRASGAPTAGRKVVHYYMDPRDQLRVYNAIDALGLDVVGYYHSHVRSEARPSPTDIRLATDLLAHYVLVSLEQPADPSVRAWKILKSDPAAETGELLEVPVRATA